MKKNSFIKWMSVIYKNRKFKKIENDMNFFLNHNLDTLIATQLVSNLIFPHFQNHNFDVFKKTFSIILMIISDSEKIKHKLSNERKREI
ncbi:hypothetical protein BpHYR1_018548 [Brachionus plicatilis]|uniref:Uncharacterized protein n=1 Tax=Brachionus plicatilis TaxID=10195 RepID=A0A3M7P8S8_BRAPC|nr:hypothetical protein BpHYR1_018548 [Brachionus plicatilis]